MVILIKKATRLRHLLCFGNDVLIRTKMFPDQAVLRPHSQKHSLHSHPAFYNQPGPKAETGSVNKEDHGLGEGVGQAINVGFFPRVPAWRKHATINLNCK